MALAVANQRLCLTTQPPAPLQRLPLRPCTLQSPLHHRSHYRRSLPLRLRPSLRRSILILPKQPSFLCKIQSYCLLFSSFVPHVFILYQFSPPTSKAHPKTEPRSKFSVCASMASPCPKPVDPSQTRVGWIGIGVMGGAMASRLQAAGYALTIYARNPSKAAEFSKRGADVAATPADVARASDVVFTMVGHPSDVREVVLGGSGILSGLANGGVIVDHTSSHPALAREIAAAARGKGCWAVDAPVSGGDIGARDGRLAILAGGDRSVVEWLAPLFEIMGKPTYVGGPGCGQSCKIANQIAVSGSMLGLSEGLVFGEQAGLDLRRFVEAVAEGEAGSKVMELFGERMVMGDLRPGGFAEYVLKDLGMGLESGDGEVGTVLPGAALYKQLYAAMVANGDGKLGTHGLITVIQRMNGK